MKRRCNKHDAFYDEDSDTWLEEICSSKDCQYCIKRPAKPSQVKNVGEDK